MKAKAKPEVALPDWLNQECWQGYIDMRKKIKKPMTPLAEKMAINMLTRLKDAGHDPDMCLQQSIFNDWQKLFAPRADFLSGMGVGLTLADYLKARKEQGKKPLDDDSPVVEYMKKTKLPDHFLKLAWVEFKNQYLQSAKQSVSTDWPQMFFTAIKSNRYKIWRVARDGQYYLSDTGSQANIVENGARQ